MMNISCVNDSTNFLSSLSHYIGRQKHPYEYLMKSPESSELNITTYGDDQALNSPGYYRYYPEDFVEVPAIHDPPYLKAYSWEYMELTKWRLWMGENWAISLYASMAYVLLIFMGQRIMRDREPFGLRGLLTAWNVGLALFSMIAFVRVLPELVHVFFRPNGFFNSVCERNSHNIVTSFYGLLMSFSKIVELGDTAFIVLRKQPLIFLHWYHHITVLVYTWFTYEAYEPPLRWFMTMNLFVHAFMYSYYALKSLRVKIPRNWAMLITCLQLSQMVVGVTINVYSLWIKANGIECGCGWKNIYLALGMYASYFLLFANFFYRAYLSKSKSKRA